MQYRSAIIHFIFPQTKFSDFGKTRSSYEQRLHIPRQSCVFPQGDNSPWVFFEHSESLNFLSVEPLYRPPSKRSTPTLVSTCKHLIQQRFFTNLQLFRDMPVLGHRIRDSIPLNQMHSLHNWRSFMGENGKNPTVIKKKISDLVHSND